MNTITRRIEIYPTGDQKKESWQKLRDWSYLTTKAANIAVSHMFFQSNMDTFDYLTEKAKVIFSDINKDDSKVTAKEREKEMEGFIRGLNCSQQNTTYRVLSEHLKGKMPSDIFSNLNAQLYATFKKENKDYKSGKKSLRSYKSGMPMPFSAKSFKVNGKADNGRDFDFTLFSMPFRTKFGRDLSGNRIIFERALMGEYKLCNSSIQIKDDKLFILAVFQFEDTIFALDKSRVFDCYLDFNTPIIARFDNKDYEIGSAQEYVHRRLAISGALKRLRIAAKYTNGGKGRKKKLVATERFELAEQNYTRTQMHRYSRELIRLCLIKNIGTIHLRNIEDVKDAAKSDKLLLANWSYYGLAQFIEYKAKKHGIDFIIDKEKTCKKNTPIMELS